jgi:hydrogenase-4 component F
LIGFGVGSVLLGAAFVVTQRDAKRLLAYSSVEHLGIMSLGIGLGGVGCFAALFHMLNHSVCKALSFCSVGRLGRIYGTHDMHRMSGVIRVSPAWGTGLIGGLVALIGVAPFSLFMSELMILKAAFDGGSTAVAVVFLAGLGIVFIGALRFVISMLWEPSAVPPRTGDASGWDWAFVTSGLLALLVLGLWMPEPLADVLSRAALVVGGRP